MMTSRFNFLTVGALLCVLAAGSVQTASAADNAEEAPGYKPFTVGAEVATPGFGGSASWRFADHFGVRGGFNYFSYSQTGVEIDGINYNNTDLRLVSEPLGVDIYPWQKSSFRITVGIMLNQNEYTGVRKSDGTFYPIGDSGIYYDSNDIGNLNLKVKQLPVSPYLSIGYSYYFDKAKHWSLSGELGVAYTGNPDVSLSTSTRAENDPGIPGQGLKQDLNTESQQIEDTFAKYKFYPILRIGVNFSF